MSKSVLPFRSRRVAAIALVLGASALPALAVPGAKCASDNATSDITAEYANGVLRCARRAVSAPVCPMTHPSYVVRGGKDECKTVNALTPPPGPLTASPNCAPGMSYVNDGGEGQRDQCRGTDKIYVVPLLVN